ncbi:MAG: hypothetical protein Rhims3KO_06760 [Hyphomicrobiales bacterium]
MEMGDEQIDPGKNTGEQLHSAKLPATIAEFRCASWQSCKGAVKFVRRFSFSFLTGKIQLKQWHR